MIAPPPGKSELPKLPADELDQLLKIQLAQNRAQWTKARQRYRAWRSVSFVFLFVVIAGALLAFLFVLSRLQH